MMATNARLRTAAPVGPAPDRARWPAMMATPVPQIAVIQREVVSTPPSLRVAETAYLKGLKHVMMETISMVMPAAMAASSTKSTARM